MAFTQQEKLIHTYINYCSFRYCELCEHHFVFTPIYRQDMPDRMPLRIICRQSIRHLAFFLRGFLRAIVVILVWLVVVPCLTLLAWRFCFWSGSRFDFSSSLKGLVSPSPNESTTDSLPIIGPQNNPKTSSFGFFGYTQREFMEDCFEGQIVTLFVVVVFVTAYLFREWVIQNTPEERNIEFLPEDELAELPPLIQMNPVDQNINHFTGPAELADMYQNEFLEASQHDREINQHQEAGHILEEFRRENEWIHRNSNRGYPNSHQDNHRQSRSSGSDDDTSEQQLLWDHSHFEEQYTNDHEEDYNESESGDDAATFVPSSTDSLLSRIDNSLENIQNSARALWSPEANPYEDSEIHSEDEFLMSEESSASRKSSSGSSDRKGKSRLERASSIEYDGYLDHRIASEYSEDDAGESSSRQPLLASWRREHDRLEIRENSQSANTRWRAPEFVPSPESAIDGGNRTASPVAPTLMLDSDSQNQIHEIPSDDESDRDTEEENPIVEEDVFDFGEDIEGVLEAIGMRGNPWMLVQNAALMSLMVSIFLGVCVWIPYMTGRIVILIRPTSFIQTPIYILRLFTDPFVDFFMDRVVLSVYATVDASYFKNHVITKRLDVALERLLLWTTEYTAQILQFIQHQNHQESALKINSMNHTVNVLDTAISFGKQTDLMQKKVEDLGYLALKRWHQFAIGQTWADRSVCVTVGYSVLIIAGSWYLTRPTAPARRIHGNTLKDIIWQQGIFLKVFFLILLELIIFPIICGALIDIATVPLFSDGSLTSHWAFIQKNPYSGWFLYWFAGTGFMFNFAVFVTLCREVVRTGVMWFIRDPSDPQFHPVQEMIERPITLLLRKLSSSAAMYSTLIIIGIGSVTTVLGYCTNLFPLSLNFGKPLSTLPVDLLAIQFLLPLLMNYIQPREYTKKLMSFWWRSASHFLRLSSFMFNERHPEEEGVHVRRTFKAWILRKETQINDTIFNEVSIEDDDADVVFKRDGMFARVPNQDTVTVHPERRMIVPVNPFTFEAIEEEERLAGHPAAASPEEERHVTTVVYIPPHFRLRIMMFVFLVWVSGSVAVCLHTITPRRSLYKMYFGPNQQMGDIYAVILGVFVMVLFSVVIDWVSQIIGRTKQRGLGASIEEGMIHVKQYMLLSVKSIYISGIIALILPLLLGVTIELYLFMVLRASEPSDEITIHLSQDWALGIVCLGIIYGVIYVLPNNALQRRIDQVVEDGISNLRLWAVTRFLFAPVVFGLFIGIILPGILAMGVIRAIPISNPVTQLLVFRYSYPAVLCITILFGLFTGSIKLIRLWIQTIRDDTYLIGKRLHNLGETTTA
ncbi:hypothetical protein PHYBLDRAFT_187244 [Phycomyces blakesleeanus NRRL 1555(-)]|uniref:RING-type E3 ubiquitin transferase n=1 Tax=Phycomyces blakesleeanus (strain ATCC 8743b / DSM 1359 / FGSC 10004 / NBRC 33097 / NRRL 1555) TaxID=763407 RepID=A0A167MIG4_PHYB8|nr:hypothetical protein PHYBLDRAFT_187244 [Phycomyces blakesleeanus NRRL 1555(-)]OAD72934.1 hypothetical protein PHYBLDRAFT_187244 [Phycomyces blakesleeanus NRRL 1555(-)]|eukprot:XP_018290974.1 hypothetical protein PHYBLDRAFT_187244 [Phycomyces blakesleeanus NRRL 1555(-)]